MAWFKSSKTPAPTEPTKIPLPGSAKNRPTPSRREAEAARMARLHPELDPKKAKEMNREAQSTSRRNQMAAVDSQPERELLRDVIDARFNIGEFALPVMLLILVVTFIPDLQAYAELTLYAMWLVVAAIAFDLFLAWRTFKKLATERIPGRSLKGMVFYAWNRQMAMRRWRMPAPRVKRGEAI